MKLLTTGNPKLMKGSKRGYLSFILHLAPSKLSGYNTCPSASAGCAFACLNTAGRGGLFPSIQEARIRKTKLFFEDRQKFMTLLVADILAAIRMADRKGMTPVFRLNGTSDIRWENIAVEDVKVPVYRGKGYAHYNGKNIMSVFRTEQFYDYRKTKAELEKLPTNYHLTFSRSETNDSRMLEVLRDGGNVAVVFGTKDVSKLPETWNGYTVVSGEDSDLRFLDPKNVVVGLTMKGKATKDDSGFVVPV